MVLLGSVGYSGGVVDSGCVWGIVCVEVIFWRVNEGKRIFEIKKPKKTKDDIWSPFRIKQVLLRFAKQAKDESGHLNGHLTVRYNRKGTNETEINGVTDLKFALNCFLEKELLDYLSKLESK